MSATGEAPFLTAAMIVRDEEAFLDGCLASIADAVDEIVIADTGSVDRSRDIARAHGAHVIEFPWTADFAAARNAALDAVRGEWVLYIDADERLAPTDRAAIRRMLDRPELIAAKPWFRPRTGFTRYREYRLFRNDPEIRFHGAIHEKISIDIHRVAGERGLRIADVELLIEHLGYDGPQDRKHRRNLPLLAAALERDSDNPYNWHHLGRIREALGDESGAVAAWQSGVDTVRRIGRRNSSDCMVFFELMRLRCRRGEPAEDLLADAERMFPENPLLLLWRGNLAVARRDFAGALPAFRALTGIDPESYSDPEVAVEKRLFGELAQAALGNCHFQLGHYVEAAACFAAAAAADPGAVEYRVKRQLAESRVGAAAQST